MAQFEPKMLMLLHLPVKKNNSVKRVDYLKHKSSRGFDFTILTEKSPKNSYIFLLNVLLKG